MSKERSIWRMLITNIKNSFRLLPPTGKLVGSDQLGNKYYQSEKNPHSMRKAGHRWFEPENPNDWQQDLPAEWEAWLRGRRIDVPTEEEIQHNLSIANMKKVKGAEISGKKIAPDGKISSDFPKFPEYEREPGFSDSKTKYG